MEKLLLVDDAERLPAKLTAELQNDYILLQVSDYAQALEQFPRFAPQVVMLDLGLPSGSEGGSLGFCCLQRMLAGEPDTKVVVVTGEGDRETGHRALRCGAYDFHQKPVNPAELKVVIRRKRSSANSRKRWSAVKRASKGSSASAPPCSGSFPR